MPKKETNCHAVTGFVIGGAADDVFLFQRCVDLCIGSYNII